MIIETRGLTKVYDGRPALDGVDLAVPRGGVYGLVGPNGSGKTTLLALLAGLRRPTAGEIRLGTDRSRIAVLPDTPQFEPWLTAREVVDLARNLTAPDIPAARVEEVLAESGLSDAIDRRVGGFSRGMLQRLGLAATVVGDPEVLLLDEPCSALDPGGRREVLDLVKRIGSRGTVLFSSHILSDVQQVSDTVGVLREGRLLYQGPLEDLLVGSAVPGYVVRVRGDATAVAARLRREEWVTGVEEQGSDLRVRVRSLAEAESRLVAALAGAGARVVSLAPEAPDLEDVFLELMR
ncbi:MAG TPA: ABC transporter ATP-binding protein [Dehalococcoidia bacterium]|nr:ABC transporter ATP-binding protein [Dehalococcoidia bacterium]